MAGKRFLRPADRYRSTAAPVAALAMSLLMISGAAAVATPTFKSTGSETAPAGTLISRTVDDLFDNTGTNPRLTGVVFSTTEYYDSGSSGIDAQQKRLWVKAKTAAQLNALPSPPPSPFTVTATVTMANDEGQTATGNVTFETTYTRSSKSTTKPIFTPTEKRRAPPGILVSVPVGDLFDNAGTNPRLTHAVFPTMAYYNSEFTVIGGRKERLFVKAKTVGELNALPSPPPSPFTVTATVTMTNDEGQTAAGTVTFETTYARNPSSPSFKPSDSVTAPVGTLISRTVDDLFDNAGTNPRLTDVVFSTTEYYDSGSTGIGAQQKRLWVKTKTAKQLSALSSPPPSTFTVTATVTMTNDEGQTAAGTVTFETTYAKE